ncbi:hypothetical protein D3C80_1860480 [compost metagenome]
MFRSHQPTVFAGTVSQAVAVLRVSPTVVQPQLQGTARVQFQTGQTHVEGVVDGRTLVQFIIQITVRTAGFGVAGHGSRQLAEAQIDILQTGTRT